MCLNAQGKLQRFLQTFFCSFHCPVRFKICYLIFRCSFNIYIAPIMVANIYFPFICHFGWELFVTQLCSSGSGHARFGGTTRCSYKEAIFPNACFVCSYHSFTSSRINEYIFQRTFNCMVTFGNDCWRIVAEIGVTQAVPGSITTLIKTKRILQKIMT